MSFHSFSPHCCRFSDGSNSAHRVSPEIRRIPATIPITAKRPIEPTRIHWEVFKVGKEIFFIEDGLGRDSQGLGDSTRQIKPDVNERRAGKRVERKYSFHQAISPVSAFEVKAPKGGTERRVFSDRRHFVKCFSGNRGQPDHQDFPGICRYKSKRRQESQGTGNNVKFH